MIVLHDFFYKYGNPRYLDKAVGMMRCVNGCGFFNHKDFETFIDLLREELKEGTGGRYEKGDISLSRTNGQISIRREASGMRHASAIQPSRKFSPTRPFPVSSCRAGNSRQVAK